MMRWMYAPNYNYARMVPFLRQVHGFVLDKPRRIYDALCQEHGFTPEAFVHPEALSLDALCEVHTEDLCKALQNNRSLAQALEFPWLGFLPWRVGAHLALFPQLHAAGGTCVALEAAQEGHWAINLSGGFHHARIGLAHGFCLVADVALGLQRLWQAGHHPRVLILDLDLHQGDGNIDCFADTDEVFTASIHQESAFPFPKLRGDLDIGLDPHTDTIDDAYYLDVLEECLETIAARFQPEILVYIAGTDIYKGDGIGAFSLSKAGIVQRDRRVATFAREQACALVTLPAGGYSPQSPEIAAAGFAAIAQIAQSETQN